MVWQKVFLQKPWDSKRKSITLYKMGTSVSHLLLGHPWDSGDTRDALDSPDTSDMGLHVTIIRSRP